MEPSVILNPPDDVTAENIRRDLEEDPQRLQKQIELFKEWLRCETYLPRDVDDRLVFTFVRQCKCNLDKAKRKFENFLLVRSKLQKYYSNRDIAPYFDEISLHKQILICPKLTPGGQRVGFADLPKDPDRFDLEKTFHFVLMLLDLVIIHDTCGSYIGVYDLKNLSTQHLGKISVKLLAEALNLIYNVAPCRIQAMHLLHVPKLPEPLVAVIKKIVPKKIAERTYVHKDTSRLKEYFPKDMIPEEYGGGLKSGIVRENFRRFFVENKKWDESIVNLKFRGPVPHQKKELYSFDDFEMGGSFRSLAID